MMTPSQEAKAYAAEHGYTLTSNYSIRRIIVSHGDREVGRYAKYEGCINAMRADQSAPFPGLAEELTKFSAVVSDSIAKIADAFASGGAPRMPVWPLLKRDSRPRWRLWVIYNENVDHIDRHNYADAVKELRKIYSDPIYRHLALRCRITLIQ